MGGGAEPGALPDRTRVPTAAEWARTVGYSRAVRVGAHVYVTGTVGLGDDGAPVAGGAYAQARRALEIIAGALRAAGAAPEHVVRTRIYVTDIADWPAVGRAHGEVFGEIRPATTLVRVAGLIDPAYVVEIEADAVVPEGGGA